MTKLNMNNLTEYNKKVVEAAIEAYVAIMGEQKWGELTAQEQHDGVMTLIVGMLEATGKI